MYAVIALAIAYFNFRRDEPGLVSAVFRPVLGDRVDGPLGQAIDVLAIIATLFGVAVSLGLGTLQIASGLSEVFGVPGGALTIVAVLAVTAVAYLLSAATGIERGVKWLSNASVVVAAALVAYFLVAGPTVLQLNALTQGTGSYLADLVPSGIDGLQQASLLAALPFTFILLAMCWSLLRGLRDEVPEENPSDPTARTEFPGTGAAASDPG